MLRAEGLEERIGVISRLASLAEVLSQEAPSAQSDQENKSKP
jgi:hypothetical protein